MSVEKDKKIKGVLRFTLLVTIPVLILTVVIISIQACNPFGKCGRPGYTYNHVGCTYNVYWSCSSPCSPSISEMHFTASGSPYNTQTVYCKDENYDTGEGVYLTITGCP